MSGDTRLTGEQRYQIHALLHTGQNPIKIAIVVGGA
jgi:hypothetical protein